MKNIDYENKRFRSWTILLYPDTKSYDFNEVIQILKSYKDYAYIKHDPDEDCKKVHYHFNLFLDNNTKRNSLSKKIGVPEMFIQSIDHIRSMNRYLTHIDYLERKQYDLDLVFVSSHYQKKFLKCYDDLETEHDIISKIYYYIDSNIITSYDNYPKACRELLLWVSDNNYESIYKKYSYEFKEYLKDMLTLCN